MGSKPSRDLKMVDRRGFAPRSIACKAIDLLNDRAAQKLDEVPQRKACDLMIQQPRTLPLRSPHKTPTLVGKENWHGVPVMLRADLVLET